MQLIDIIAKVWANVERQCFHPALFDDAEELSRARLMLVMCLVHCAFLIPVVVFSYVQEPDQLMVNLIVLIGHLLVMLTFILLRFFSTTRVPVHAITVVATLQLLNGAFWSGGSQSVVLYTYPIAPFFFGLLGRVTHGAVSAFCLLCGLVGFYYMEQLGIDFHHTGSSTEVNMLTLGWATLTGLGMATYSRVLSSRKTDQLKQGLEQRAVAEQKASVALESKDWFVAYLSHEMRNPLSVIAGGVDLLSRAGSDSERNRQIKVLRTASMGMSRLMDDVLDISALERGRINLEMKKVDIGPILVGLQQSFSPLAELKGLAFEVEAPKGAVYVIADGQRLRQILSNLIDNAVKFTASGGVSVSVRLVEDRVHIEVADTGRGIQSKDWGRIFEPFARAGEGGVRGAGLGLAIVRMLTDQMGSHLKLDSVVGEGSSFWFELDRP